MPGILIFGADGLIGHHLFVHFRQQTRTFGTLHGSRERYPESLFPRDCIRDHLAAEDTPTVARALDSFRPDWVINAIGLVKRPLADHPLASLEANTLFPHRLANLCGQRGIRLLHFSTDCVFSGKHGSYAESDLPDNPDWHGRCKALGEPVAPHVLVLRTSFIGLELGCRKSLVEWFLAQTGEIPGYTRAIWNGLTAAEICRAVEHLISRESPAHGLWHLSARQAISKHDLLRELNDRLPRRNAQIVQSPDFVCDRSLNGEALRQQFGYCPPDYPAMLDELAEDILIRRGI